MATAAPTEESTPVSSRIDNIRERELYRFFQPPPDDPSSTLCAHEASSPDTALTALAQLCAIRLNAKRAMISLIDRENQYFIAEATKSLDLANTNKSEVEGDSLWFGCGTVDKSGRLCEKTIELPPCLGRYPCFTVKDLSKDERFNQLPFVTGPPYFKFYAGTPLTTKRGVNIGSLFIIDDVIRERLPEEQEHFLGTIARTVMEHLEMAGEAQERKKMMRLSLGMNCFVEGKSQLETNEANNIMASVLKPTPNGVKPSSPAKRSDSGSRSFQRSPSRHTESAMKQRRADIESPSEPETSQDESDTQPAPTSGDSGHRMTFSRAANILCDSLDVRDRGGVIFFDTTSRLRTRHDSSGRPSQRPAEILAYATSEPELGKGDQVVTRNLPCFSAVDEGLLGNLLSRHRHGKLWTFDPDGSLSSSEEEYQSPQQFIKKAEKHKRIRLNDSQVEASLLQKYFPGVRQLLFSGLWDAGSSRWFSAGFAWTISNRLVLSKETELGYFMAFGNSIMAEVSRLASLNADRQKADFIGSISHEFRSPLHGILASAEFLAETEVDSFQGSLVDTMSSCGRTLLDTINHILDYSKINSFERTWRNVRKPGHKHKALASRRLANKDAPPMMSIYATIDVAAIVEEVVEGVYAGQIYQDISSTDATDFSNAARTEAVNRGIAPRKAVKAKDVDVQIDIAYEDYNFTTQPGALKRVIMNVFGNALKYTTEGTIKVKLSLAPNEDGSEETTSERVMELKVIDTGKGISSEYLRTSLFNPFCQEDPLASGTGLGLSIVRSIVTTLSGTIDIQSEVGKGTEVTVRLPLSRLPGNDTPVSTPSSTVTDGSTNDSIDSLKAEHGNISVALIGFDANEEGPALAKCIGEWLGLHVIPLESHEREADICVISDYELLQRPQEHNTSPTVVLCNNPTRTQSASRHSIRNVTAYVSKPVGPHKLAKVLRSCLNRAKLVKGGLAPIIAYSDEESPLESEADTVMPDMEMEALTLDNEQSMKPLEVHTNGIITVSDSDNAQMAMDRPPSPKNGATAVGEQAFPFPAQDDPDKAEEPEEDQSTPGPGPKPKEATPRRGDLTRRDSRRPPLISRLTEPIVKSLLPSGPKSMNHYEGGIVLPFRPPNQSQATPKRAPEGTADSNTDLTTPTAKTSAHGEERTQRPPRLLLVDDNKINLRLLETYMRKRKYQSIDMAENGQFAVQAAEAHNPGYDIIFMDISMPVMNGFEATRAIRDIEDARGYDNNDPDAPSPAFIIALTGLASSRDQTEAFTSGVDLFMTKPVSFKEVGRLLDNWEAQGGIKPRDDASGVP